MEKNILNLAEEERDRGREEKLSHVFMKSNFIALPFAHAI